MKRMLIGLLLGSSLTLNVVGWITLVASAKQIKDLQKKVDTLEKKDE